jgi:hypothetical protein
MAHAMRRARSSPVHGGVHAAFQAAMPAAISAGDAPGAARTATQAARAVARDPPFPDMAGGMVDRAARMASMAGVMGVMVLVRYHGQAKTDPAVAVIDTHSHTRISARYHRQRGWRGFHPMHE